MNKYDQDFLKLFKSMKPKHEEEVKIGLQNVSYSLEVQNLEALLKWDCDIEFLQNKTIMLRGSNLLIKGNASIPDDNSFTFDCKDTALTVALRIDHNDEVRPIYQESRWHID